MAYIGTGRDIMTEGCRPEGIMSFPCQYLPYGTRAWVITNLLHDVEDHYFQGLMY